MERTEICLSCISSRLSACPNYLCCLNCRLRWWSNRFQTVLWKKNPNSQNGLKFAFLSSYWIQFCFFIFITSARIWGLPIYWKWVLFWNRKCSFVRKIKFKDGVFFAKNLVKQSNIFDHSVIKIHKKTLSSLLLMGAVNDIKSVHSKDTLSFETILLINYYLKG